MKKVLSLLLALVLALGTSVAVFADDNGYDDNGYGYENGYENGEEENGYDNGEDDADDNGYDNGEDDADDNGYENGEDDADDNGYENGDDDADDNGYENGEDEEAAATEWALEVSDSYDWVAPVGGDYALTLQRTVEEPLLFTIKYQAIDGVMYVPFREVAAVYDRLEELAWDGENRVVILGELRFAIGEHDSFIENNTTYVPFAFAWEVFEGEVTPVVVSLLHNEEAVATFEAAEWNVVLSLAAGDVLTFAVEGDALLAVTIELLEAEEVADVGDDEVAVADDDEATDEDDATDENDADCEDEDCDEHDADCEDECCDEHEDNYDEDCDDDDCDEEHADDCCGGRA